MLAPESSGASPSCGTVIFTTLVSSFLKYYLYISDSYLSASNGLGCGVFFLIIFLIVYVFLLSAIKVLSHLLCLLMREICMVSDLTDNLGS